jgi:hypothetical protein
MWNRASALLWLAQGQRFLLTFSRLKCAIDDVIWVTVNLLDINYNDKKNIHKNNSGRFMVY